jgi:uncharacterized C2H2 Zn-finger protein
MSEAVAPGLAKTPDELTDEDLELLWVVAQEPDATLGELGEAYGFPTPEPIREDLDELLEDVSDRDEVVPPLFENDVVEYEPSELDKETVEELDEMCTVNSDSTEQSDAESEAKETCPRCGEEFETMESRRAHEVNCSEGFDEMRVCEECGDEFDTDRALSIHVTRAHETDYTDTQLDFLRAILKHPNANQRELASTLDISRSGVEYRSSAIREEYGEFEWNERHAVAREILEEQGEEIPDETVDDVGREYECPKCDRTFDTSSALGSHERSCDGGPSERQREILEAIRENPDAQQKALGEELDASTSSLSYVMNEQLGYSWGERHEAVEEYLGEDEHEDEQDEPEVTVEHGGRSTQDVLAAGEEDDDEPDETETPRVKNEDSDYVDLTEECMSEHTEREATVPSDTLVDSVLRVDEDIVRRLRHTGAAVAEIGGEVVRLEVAE